MKKTLTLSAMVLCGALVGLPGTFNQSANLYAQGAVAVSETEPVETPIDQAYMRGRGIEQDYKEAVTWFLKATEKEGSEEVLRKLRENAGRGNPGSQCIMGCWYAKKDSVQHDYREAVKWWQKAAEQGHARAQLYLSLCYYEGKGVEQDFKEAVKWNRMAAEQGDVFAQFLLGTYYLDEGVEQDYKEAVKWFLKAAEKEDAGAEYFLGVCYYNGQGVEQDYKKAADWFRKAAEHTVPQHD